MRLRTTRPANQTRPRALSLPIRPVTYSATGSAALRYNTSGSGNTAIGSLSLVYNTTGNENSAIGSNALFHNTTGLNNIALGYKAGENLTTGNNNIDIGNRGVAGESDTIRIGTQGTQTDTYIAGI